MLRVDARCVVQALLRVSAGLVTWVDVSLSACVEVRVDPVRVDRVIAAKDLESLMQSSGVSIPSLHRISVNGVVLEVGELRIGQPVAQRLLRGLQQQAVIDGGWKASVGAGDRVVLSRWDGARHEALSLRRIGLGYECLANYSRQDLRNPVAATARLPVRVPREFSLLTTTEEKTIHGVVRTFTFDYRGPLRQARQRVVAALQADHWTLELKNFEKETGYKWIKGVPPVFATRGGVQLQAAMVAESVSVRLVMQIFSPH